MLSKEEFVRWIDASHDLFQVFEGRYDAYPIARRWVDELFSKGRFSIDDSDRERLGKLVNNLNFDAFGIKEKVKESIRSELTALLDRIDDHQSSAGFAVSFFLFTWNLQRFRKYFERKPEFSLVEYFEQVGEGLEKAKDTLLSFRNRNLLFDEINESEVKDVFYRINEILREVGIRNNEPIGTIKLLHMFFPAYFQLLDNPIAVQLGLKLRNKSIDAEFYIGWMMKLKNWLSNYKEVVSELENRHDYGILKLVDEGLYIMCSVNLQIRTAKLGIL